MFAIFARKNRRNRSGLEQMQGKFLFSWGCPSAKAVVIVIILNVIDFNFFAQFKHLIKYNRSHC